MCLWENSLHHRVVGSNFFGAPTSFGAKILRREGAIWIGPLASGAVRTQQAPGAESPVLVGPSALMDNRRGGGIAGRCSCITAPSLDVLSAYSYSCADVLGMVGHGQAAEGALTEILIFQPQTWGHGQSEVHCSRDAGLHLILSPLKQEENQQPDFIPCSHSVAVGPPLGQGDYRACGKATAYSRRRVEEQKACSSFMFWGSSWNGNNEGKLEECWDELYLCNEAMKMSLLSMSGNEHQANLTPLRHKKFLREQALQHAALYIEWSCKLLTGLLCAIWPAWVLTGGEMSPPQGSIPNCKAPQGAGILYLRKAK